MSALLPDPGKGRFWLVKHEPKKVKVLRIELREKLRPELPTMPSLSTLIGWINAHATDADVKKACDELKLNAGRSFEFLGIHD